MAMSIREAWLALDEDFHHRNHLCSEFAARCGVSDTAFLVLYTLRAYGEGQMQHRIAALWHVAPQSVNSAVKHLLKLGYLRLGAASGGGRGKALFLTPEGLEFCRGGVDAFLRSEAEILEQLSAEELELYVALSRRLTQAMEAALRPCREEAKDEFAG